MSTMKGILPGRPLNRAFSMPELLVCLGIVAILVSLALPALAKVKARASTNAAVSNARQLATLIQQYAADWRDLPPCVFAPIYSRYSEGPWQTATLNGRDLRAGSWFGNAIYYHHLLGSDETIRRIAFAPSRPADKRTDSPTNWSSDFSPRRDHVCYPRALEPPNAAGSLTVPTPTAFRYRVSFTERARASERCLHPP
jgi:prepilin-type N-terminal cleavage/methylation domain-containing protein